MGAVNYDVAGSKPADKGVFALTLEVIADSQMQRAEREFVRQEHLMAQKSTLQRDSETEPFGGW
jgi:hypothetical protein